MDSPHDKFENRCFVFGTSYLKKQIAESGPYIESLSSFTSGRKAVTCLREHLSEFSEIQRDEIFRLLPRLRSQEGLPAEDKHLLKLWENRLGTLVHIPKPPPDKLSLRDIGKCADKHFAHLAGNLVKNESSDRVFEVAFVEWYTIHFVSWKGGLSNHLCYTTDIWDQSWANRGARTPRNLWQSDWSMQQVCGLGHRQVIGMRASEVDSVAQYFSFCSKVILEQLPNWLEGISVDELRKWDKQWALSGW